MSTQNGAGTSPSELVTLIITTSPTPSAPSTDLISDILASFKLHCEALLSCRVIVVFDTYDRIGESMRLKKGQITAEGARAVEQYKTNVKDLILNEWYPKAAEAAHVFVHGQAWPKPAGRVGFGLAVRSALRMTETPYVWVQQHDWPLARDIPLASLVKVMQASEGDTTVPVKYVCLPAIRMLSYATSAHVLQFPTLRALTAKLKRDFPTSDGARVPLTPLFFWHDKPHVASTAHYLARVFPSRLAIARGDFIEDSVGQRARTQMKDGNWTKWACWLYYPADGREVCLQHRHGRKWRGVEADVQTKALFAEMRSKLSSPLPAS
ncbi:hypothetical protein CIB48_g11373 [Xylaria polymorpha]|nr:hypothetical protein CIB48_g11373 [Xylaria polymorpha]